jgi:hypothetical protein
MLRKIPKNPLFYSLFSDHLRVDRFIGFSTDLSVVPIGKPVIPTGIPASSFSNSKFKFRPVFAVTGHTGGERFLTRTGISIPVQDKISATAVEYSGSFKLFRGLRENAWWAY